VLTNMIEGVSVQLQLGCRGRTALHPSCINARKLGLSSTLFT
jgi:hypothetical protein